MKKITNVIKLKLLSAILSLATNTHNKKSFGETSIDDCLVHSLLYKSAV